jgi:hypothetical protein
MLEVNVQRRPLGGRPRFHSLPHRRTDAFAALSAGLLAGAVALTLMQVFAVAVYDESFWRLFRMVAALVRGPAVLEPDDEFDAAIVAIGATLYLALSLLYALALCRLVADTPRRYAIVMGLAFGLALYYANFYGFTLIFPWFAPHRTVDTLIVHAIFGVIAARSYWTFHRLSPR